MISEDEIYYLRDTVGRLTEKCMSLESEVRTLQVENDKLKTLLVAAEMQIVTADFFKTATSEDIERELNRAKGDESSCNREKNTVK